MSVRKVCLSLDWEMHVGRFIQRLNRFLVEAKLESHKALAHLPNSGRLSTVLAPNVKVFLRKVSGKTRKRKRKTEYDVFAVKNRDVLTIVDTRFSSFLAEKAIEKGLFKLLKDYKVKKRNFRVENSILDLKLVKNGELFFVEVKSVTHVIGGVALFPDAPTKRGARHVQLLTRLREQGFNTGILFSVQRNDAEVLKPNRQVDPKFSSLLEKAVEKGVKVFVQTSVFQPPNIVEIAAGTPRFQLK